MLAQHSRGGMLVNYRISPDGTAQPFSSFVPDGTSLLIKSCPIAKALGYFHALSRSRPSNRADGQDCKDAQRATDRRYSKSNCGFCGAGRPLADPFFVF